MTKLPKGFEIQLYKYVTLKYVSDGSAHHKTKSAEYRGEASIHYYNEKGLLHRDDDKPAVVMGCDSGEKSWYQNGELHRDGDKPAIIYSDGSKAYYRNGEEYDLPNLEHQVKLSKDSVKNYLNCLAIAKKVLKADQDKLASYKKKQEADRA